MTELRLTKRQAQIISAYTGTLCCTPQVFQEFVEELVGRKVDPVEFMVTGPGTLQETINDLVKPMFMELTYTGD